jgi:E3 ubiquitin-protein ligase SHPRH
LYKEALTLAHENINDFRVDPLLNLHINYNLAELLRSSSEYLQECPLKDQPHGLDIRWKRKENSPANSDLCGVKRNKVCMNNTSNLTANGLETYEEDKNVIGQTCANREVNAENVSGCHSSFECSSVNCLRKTCNAITEKYLSVFTARLAVAQKDFSAASTEVCSVHFSTIFLVEPSYSNLIVFLLFYYILNP